MARISYLDMDDLADEDLIDFFAQSNTKNHSLYLQHDIRLFC